MDLRIAPFVFVALVASGCGPAEVSVPETPPPATPPVIDASRVYTPNFRFRNKEKRAGTEFLLSTPAGKLFALTAYHVIEKNEWSAAPDTTFTSHGQAPPISLSAPIYRGRGFDELHPHVDGDFPVFDTSEDFAIWSLNHEQALGAVVSKLAPEDPKGNEWVWVGGSESGKPFALYLAKVTRVRSGTMMLQQHQRFEPRGFSGAPVFRADGKIVGNVAAANPATGQMAGATAGTIQKRIARY